MKGGCIPLNIMLAAIITLEDISHELERMVRKMEYDFIKN